MAVSMKMAVFWAVALYSLVEVYQHFRGACSLYHQTLLVEAVSTSEMSVNVYQTTYHNNPEDSCLHSTIVMKLLT
jgi:predicted transcriptional regulator